MLKLDLASGCAGGLMTELIWRGLWRAWREDEDGC